MADQATLARGIVDANLYMTLGTADADGQPWASPVYYAADAYRDFYWVSSPDARHSLNIAARPEVGIVIFDSRVALGQAQAVYMMALAEQLTGAELERGIEVFSRVSVAHGASEWTAADAQPPALHRLYRATVSEHSILDPERQGVDSRTRVVLG